MSSMLRTAAKAIVSVSQFMAWASSAIVVGISGYYLARYPHDMRQIFYMIVVCYTPSRYEISIF